MKTNFSVSRDVQLTTLALAIALGWSLYQTAFGLATVVEGLAARMDYPRSPLSWQVGHRVLILDQLIMGLVELGTVLLVATFVQMRRRRSSDD